MIHEYVQTVMSIMKLITMNMIFVRNADNGLTGGNYIKWNLLFLILFTP